MKNSNAQKLSLGIFVILGTIAFIFAIYLIGQKEHLFKKTIGVKIGVNVDRINETKKHLIGISVNRI